MTGLPTLRCDSDAIETQLSSARFQHFRPPPALSLLPSTTKSCNPCPPDSNATITSRKSSAPTTARRVRHPTQPHPTGTSNPTLICLRALDLSSIQQGPIHSWQGLVGTLICLLFRCQGLLFRCQSLHQAYATRSRPYNCPPLSLLLALQRTSQRPSANVSSHQDILSLDLAAQGLHLARLSNQPGLSSPAYQTHIGQPLLDTWYVPYTPSIHPLTNTDIHCLKNTVRHGGGGAARERVGVV